MIIASRKQSGFTLVELLVAIAVLAILGVIFAQMTAMTGSAIRLSNQSIDAASEAFLSFDRIRSDLIALVKRPDVDFIAQNPTDFIANSSAAGGDNIMLFLSNVASAGIAPGATGLSANRNVSVVAYQINEDSDNGGWPCLMRAGKPLTWNNTEFVGLDPNTGLPISFNSGTFPTALLPSSQGNPSDFDVLAPGVIRMVVGFQLYPDNQPANLSSIPGSWSAAAGWAPSGTAIANAQGQLVYSPPLRSVTPTTGGVPIAGATAVNYIDWSRISALVVGVVALNADLAKTAQPAQLVTIAQQFPLSATGVLPLGKWISVADQLGSPGGGASSVPLPIRQAVHVFQQTSPITPYGTKGD